MTPPTFLPALRDWYHAHAAGISAEGRRWLARVGTTLEDTGLAQVPLDQWSVADTDEAASLFPTEDRDGVHQVVASVLRHAGYSGTAEPGGSRSRVEAPRDPDDLLVPDWTESPPAEAAPPPAPVVPDAPMPVVPPPLGQDLAEPPTDLGSPPADDSAGTGAGQSSSGGRPAWLLPVGIAIVVLLVVVFFLTRSDDTTPADDGADTVETGEDTSTTTPTVGAADPSSDGTTGTDGSAIDQPEPALDELGNPIDDTNPGDTSPVIELPTPADGSAAPGTGVDAPAGAADPADAAGEAVCPGPQLGFVRIVNVTESANARAEPTTDSELVVQVPLGTRMPFHERGVEANGYEWFRVVLPNDTCGWVADLISEVE